MRLKKLFRPWSIPGWILALWDLADHLSRAEFVSRGMGVIRPGLMNLPSWWVTIVGFVWLSVILFWDTIRSRFEQWLPVKKTTSERLSDVEGKIGMALKVVSELPNYSRCLYAIMEVVREATEIHHAYSEILSLYPTSRVAQRPFSNWRPRTPPDAPLCDAERDGVKWARALELHRNRVLSFLSDWPNVRLDRSEDYELFDCVAHWKDDMSGDKCLELLRMHCGRLISARDDYSASLIEDASQRQRTS